MQPVIRIENLSKSYRIQHGKVRGEYRTLRDTLTDVAAWPLRRLRGHDNGRVEEFWALKDVNLEVHQGDVVGIIGRNGAGKSTLLKILSRITAPTSGRVELHGRVGSLLEVGTGFHPELTGRENVYLNGSILGMSRREIQKKFDEIVEFSGVERFLDTPVKRFSSGMYVRLAFAVAAHLEPEILIVDEVLAVGDAEFQKKCLGRMEDVAKHGRTVLFVSHNMAAVSSLCSRAVLLQGGQVVIDAECEKAIGSYYSCSSDSSKGPNDGLAHTVLEIKPELDMQMREVTIRNDAGELLHCDVAYEGSMTIEIQYEVRRPKPGAYVCFCFSDIVRGDSWWQYDADTPIFGQREEGIYTATIDVPPAFFRAGRYFFRASIVELGRDAIDYRGTLFHVTIGDTRSALASKGVPWPTTVKYAARWITKPIA